MKPVLRISLPLMVAAVLRIGGVLAVSSPAAADDNHNETKAHAHDLGDVWAIARGGQLYDNWIAVTEAGKPKATPPAYPKAGKKKGAST